MPTKSTGLTVSIAPTSLSPDDLLALARLDDLPAMAEVLEHKETLSNALAQCEENMHTMRRQIAFYSQKDQTDPALAASMATETTAKLHELEREHTRLIGELRPANAAIAEAREHTRQTLLPSLAAMALPIIESKLRDLEILSCVGRLMETPAPVRSVRESLLQERRYLEVLRTVLEEGHNDGIV